MQRLTVTVSTWEIANSVVAELANGLPIFRGTGAPIDRPHVLISVKDTLSSQGMGYDVWVYPDGDAFGKPCEYHSIEIG